MYRSAVFALIIVMLCASCAATQAPDAYFQRRAAETRSHIASGDFPRATYNLEMIFVSSDEIALKMVQHLQTARKGSALQDIYDYYASLISITTSTKEFNRLYNAARRFAAVGAFAPEQYESLIQTLEARVHDANKTGAADITLADDYSNFRSLADSDSKDVIFQRSLAQLEAGDSRQAEALRVFAITDASAEQKEQLRTRLLAARVGPSELEQFAALFPGEMESALGKYRVNLSFDIPKDADPSLMQAADIVLNHSQVYQDNPNVNNHYHIKFDNFSVAERQIPDRTEVVRYSSHEVNLVGAFLTMPRGASYIYDIHTGGVSVEYRGRISVSSGGKTLSSRAVSNGVELTYSYCDNARIQNVFGGIERAQFVANAQMENRCARDVRSVDYKRAYHDLAELIAEEILSLPEISQHIP